MLTTKKKQGIIKEYRKSASDTGSPEVQIAILTKRITGLVSHLKKNHKDNHSRRGLLQMVADRHAHVRYLKKKSIQRYNALAKKLKLK